MEFLSGATTKDVLDSAPGQPVAAMFDQRLPVMQGLRRELSQAP